MFQRLGEFRRLEPGAQESEITNISQRAWKIDRSQPHTVVKSAITNVSQVVWKGDCGQGLASHECPRLNRDEVIWEIQCGEPGAPFKSVALNVRDSMRKGDLSQPCSAESGSPNAQDRIGKDNLLQTFLTLKGSRPNNSALKLSTCHFVDVSCQIWLVVGYLTDECRQFCDRWTRVD